MDKILTFIVNEQQELLLLHNNPINPIHGGDIWYTVTGGVEKIDQNINAAVKREVKEETNLDVIDSMYLNVIYKYKSRKGIDCIEYVYISFVKNNQIVLNEESIGYKWLDIDSFVKEIHWYGDKSALKDILNKAINKQLFYQKEKIIDYK